MAEGLNLNDQPGIHRAVDERAVDALPAHVRIGHDHASRPAPSPHSHKFLAATAMLVGLAIGAVAVALVVLLNHTSPATATAWSAWSPPDQGVAGEREIAAEVAPFYRATPANQLVVVTVQNVPDASSNQGSASTSSSGGLELALRDPSSGSLSALPGNSAVYNLCGLGPNCAINVGTPSSARLLLLRREALELALYTLKYIHGVQNVVAVLPPGHTTATAQLTAKPPLPGKTVTSSTVDLAVVFEKNALQRYLSRPVNQTLPEDIPPSVTDMPAAPEAELVSVLTGEALFQHQLIQAQDGSNVLVLSQVPPQ